MCLCVRDREKHTHRVYVHVYVYIQLCGVIQVKEQLGCQFLLPTLFKTESFSFPALCIWGWLSFEILEALLPIYSPVGMLGLQTLVLWCLPSRKFWDLNSGHQVCTTTPLPTEQSQSPHFYLAAWQINWLCFQMSFYFTFYYKHHSRCTTH